MSAGQSRSNCLGKSIAYEELLIARSIQLGDLGILPESAGLGIECHEFAIDRVERKGSPLGRPCHHAGAGTKSIPFGDGNLKFSQLDGLPA